MKVKSIKHLILICSAMLFLALAPLPIGYYTLLRVVITIGAVLVIYKEFENRGFDFWIISFGFIAIVFNPILPVYLGDKSNWVIVDLISAIIFLIKAIKTK